MFFSKSHHILNVHYISNQLARFAVPFDLCNRSYGITTHSASTKVTLWQFWNFILDVFTRGPWATLLTWENNREEDLWPFNWINLNPLYQRWLCAKLNWKCSSDSGEDFWIPSMYFRLLCNYLSPWKRVGPFIWTNLNSLQPRMLCSKFGSSERKMIPQNKSTDCIFVKTYHRLCLCKNKSQISFMSK